MISTFTASPARRDAGPQRAGRERHTVDNGVDALDSSAFPPWRCHRTPPTVTMFLATMSTIPPMITPLNEILLMNSPDLGTLARMLEPWDVCPSMMLAVLALGKDRFPT